VRRGRALQFFVELSSQSGERTWSTPDWEWQTQCHARLIVIPKTRSFAGSRPLGTAHSFSIFLDAGRRIKSRNPVRQHTESLPAPGLLALTAINGGGHRPSPPEARHICNTHAGGAADDEGRFSKLLSRCNQPLFVMGRCCGCVHGGGSCGVMVISKEQEGRGVNPNMSFQEGRLPSPAFGRGVDPQNRTNGQRRCVGVCKRAFNAVFRFGKW